MNLGPKEREQDKTESVSLYINVAPNQIYRQEPIYFLVGHEDNGNQMAVAIASSRGCR